MPGTIEKVNVKVGDKVSAGDPLVIMIAMKMEVNTNAHVMCVFLIYRVTYMCLNAMSIVNLCGLQLEENVQKNIKGDTLLVILMWSKIEGR